MKTTRPVIRPLTPDEVPDIISVWKKAGLNYRPAGRDSPVRLRAQIRANPDLFLGAFIRGRLVGVVLGSDDGRRGWVNRLAVLPEARRTGIAGALVTACESALRKRGRRLFCAMIERGNEASMALFEKIGYAREDYIVYFAKRPVSTY